MTLNEIQKQNIRELMAQLPSSMVNNERTYWRKKLEKYYLNPVEWRARELEDRFTGLSVDLSDGDVSGDERGSNPK